MREGEIKTNNLIITEWVDRVVSCTAFGETAISEGYDVSIKYILGYHERRFCSQICSAGQQRANV